MIETAEKYGLFLEEKVSLSDFRKAFKRCGRCNQFSYEGLEKLFNYLEGVEAEIDEEFELDVEGFCCAFSEYDDMKENGNLKRRKNA